MQKLVGLLFILLIIANPGAGADKSTAYRMTAIPIVAQSRYDYDINGTKYSSVSKLIKAIQRIPRGSTLHWEPSDLHPAGVPPQPLSNKDLKEIETICKRRNIKFVTLYHG